MKADVVILNWERQQHIRDYLIPVLLKCPEIGKIIISHGKRETFFDYPDARVVCLDHSQENQTFGLSLRFSCFEHLTSEAMMILDDDMLVTPAHIKQLVDAYQAKPDHIHGYDARYVFRTSSGLVYARMRHLYKYILDPVFRAHFFGERPKPVITLTKTLIAPASAAKMFCESRPLVEEFVRTYSKPLWNGEDIFFSLVFHARTGRHPIIHKPITKLRETPQAATGISSQKGFHYQYRSAFVRHAAEALQLAF